MADFYTDQAQGLRRLMGRIPFQVIAFGQSSAKIGQSTLIANVALRLARLGRNVLIMDEHPDAGILHYFGKPYSRVLQSLSTHVRALKVDDSNIQSPYFKRLLNIDPPIDTVLIDGAVGSVSYWLLNADEVILSVNTHAQSVSTAYQMIQRLSQKGIKHSNLFVNLVENPKQAYFTFEKLSQTLQSRQIAQLYSAGFLCFDPLIAQTVNTGAPFLKHHPDSQSAQIYYNFAENLQNMDEGRYANLDQFLERMSA